MELGCYMGEVPVPPDDLNSSVVFDRALLQDQRVPADMILVRTTEKTGSCFIRTDQLDGETDWKLRLAVTKTQVSSVDLGVHTG